MNDMTTTFQRRCKVTSSTKNAVLPSSAPHTCNNFSDGPVPPLSNHALKSVSSRTFPRAHRVSFQNLPTTERRSSENVSQIKRVIQLATKRASFQQNRRLDAKLLSVIDGAQMDRRTPSQSSDCSRLLRYWKDPTQEHEPNCRTYELTPRIDPSPNDDGIYRSGNPITSSVWVQSFDNAERKLIRVHVSLVGTAVRSAEDDGR